ncbi:MAG TPA: hypothetical protein PKX80_07940, partial [Flexilinea sp.]|nr:hypothetical protein [Flexilinea sp.]
MAIVIALASNIRIVGFILLIVTCIYLIYAVLIKEISKKEIFINGMIFVGINILLFFLLLPASWGNPIDFLIKSLHHFSKNYYESQELYLGKYVPSMHLPWHYLPVWIFISTPIVYIVLFLIGVFYLIKQFQIKNSDQI